MKILIPVLLALLASPSALAEAAQNCPALPPDSGLEWAYRQGIDYGVCHATDVESKANVLGIYFGNHPNFRPKWRNRAGRGRVAGHKVVWYKKQNADPPAAMAQEALISLDAHGYVAHVWFSAETAQEVASRLALLEQLQLQL